MGNPNRLVYRFLAILLAAALLAGCQGTMSRNASKNLSAKIDKTMDKAAKDAAGGVPSDVSDALLPPLEIKLPEGKRAIDSKFNFTVSAAPARQVFLNLVEGTQYSVVIAPAVSGRISLDLRDTSVPEAMRAIRRVYGYGFHREGNRFYISGRGMQTRLFPVNYLNFVRKGESNTRVIGGDLGQSGGGSGSDSSSSSDSSDEGGSGSSRMANTQISTTSESQFWKELQTTLETIIGDKGGRRVIVNPATNLVVVRALPSELRVVEDFLGVAHDTINRQVVLEAKIIEVELSGRYQAGINWAAMGSVSGHNITLGQTGGGTVFPTEASTLGTPGNAGTSGNTGDLVGVQPSGTDVSAFGGVFSLAVTGGNFFAFMELLKSQGDIQVLSSPRVSTINNQKAVIKIGGDEFFVTGVSQNATVSGGGAVITPEITLTPFFSGIALDVTPQIDRKGYVNLHIHPTVSEVGNKQKEVVIGSDTYSLPTAASRIQESDNVVYAKSGQIIVIGGLMREGTSDDNSSVPILGDMPIVGNLFKHKRVVRIKKELVILLKPTVVKRDQTWSDMIRESRESMGALRKSEKRK